MKKNFFDKLECIKYRNTYWCEESVFPRILVKYNKQSQYLVSPMNFIDQSILRTWSRSVKLLFIAISSHSCSHIKYTFHVHFKYILYLLTIFNVFMYGIYTLSLFFHTDAKQMEHTHAIFTLFTIFLKNKTCWILYIT